ncbi:MAG: hypothetical protein R2764_00265 [Bacteroidales bacterium]
MEIRFIPKTYRVSPKTGYRPFNDDGIRYAMRAAMIVFYFKSDSMCTGWENSKVSGEKDGFNPAPISHDQFTIDSALIVELSKKNEVSSGQPS